MGEYCLAGDNKIQEFLYTTSQVNFDTDLHRPSTSSRTKRQATADAQKAINSLRNVGQLVLTSSEFRELLSHFVLSARDILADSLKQATDTAITAADAARPNEKEREHGVDWATVEKKTANAKAGYESGRLRGEAMMRSGEQQERARQVNTSSKSSFQWKTLTPCTRASILTKNSHQAKRLRTD